MLGQLGVHIILTRQIAKANNSLATLLVLSDFTLHLFLYILDLLAVRSVSGDTFKISIQGCLPHSKLYNYRYSIPLISIQIN